MTGISFHPCVFSLPRGHLSSVSHSQLTSHTALGRFPQPEAFGALEEEEEEGEEEEGGMEGRRREKPHELGGA